MLWGILCVLLKLRIVTEMYSTDCYVGVRNTDKKDLFVCGRYC